MNKTHDINEQLVKQVLKDFDFAKVHAYMVNVGWTWGLKPHVPSVGELYQEAERICMRAIEIKGTNASGGLIAHSNGNVLELSFNIAETAWDKDELKSINEEASE